MLGVQVMARREMGVAEEELARVLCSGLLARGTSQSAMGSRVLASGRQGVP